MICDSFRKLLSIERDGFYRIFKVGKIRVKLFSTKYALRQIEQNNLEMIHKIDELSKQTIDLNKRVDEGSDHIKASLQLYNDNLMKLGSDIISSNERVLSQLNDWHDDLHTDVESCKKSAKILNGHINYIYQQNKCLEAVIFDDVPNYSSITLEFTNICAYNCFFCPREKITRELKEISDDEIRIVAKALGNQLSKKIYMFTDGMGEVLLLDDFIHKIQLIKELMPNFIPAVVSTLGYKKNDDFWNDLVLSGVGLVQVSIYGYDCEDYARIHGFDGYDLARANIDKLISAAQGRPSFKIEIWVDGFNREDYRVANPSGEWEKHEINKKAFVEYLKQFPGVKVFERKVHNRGAGEHFRKPSSVKNCFSKDYPNRYNKLYITCDLKVIPCPMIYNEELVFGDLHTDALDEIYKGEKFIRFKKAIENGDFSDYPSCANCSV